MVQMGTLPKYIYIYIYGPQSNVSINGPLHIASTNLDPLLIVPLETKWHASQHILSSFTF